MRKSKLITSDTLPYELDFIKKCKENKIKVIPDEDGCPIAIRKMRKKTFKMGSWRNNQIDVLILASSHKTLETFKNKIEEKNVKYSIHVEGDTESLLLFDIKDIKIVAKIFKFKHRKQLTPEHLAKIKASGGLEKARLARKK